MARLEWWVLLFLILPFSLQGWEGGLLLEEGWGALHGYTQIPKGGSYETTSNERPSFNEIDLSHNAIFHAQGILQYKQAFTAFNYYRFTPSQNTFLDYDLLTHSQFIPAGSPFAATIHYNWYQLGWGWELKEYSPQWFFRPALAIDWLKFMYHFEAPTAQSRRQFNLLTASLHFQVEHVINPKWQIHASGGASLPFSRLQLYTASLGSQYTLPLTQYIAFYPRLTIGGIYVDYEDGQIIPNHFRYEMAPYVSLGFWIGSL